MYTYKKKQKLTELDEDIEIQTINSKYLKNSYFKNMSNIIKKYIHSTDSKTVHMLVREGNRPQSATSEAYMMNSETFEIRIWRNG